VQYVRAFNASAAEVQPAGDVAAGKAFFFGKGRCASCHMVKGEGKANGPDLSDVGRQLTVREMEQMLDNPTAQMGARSTSTCPGWAYCPQDTWSVVQVELRSGRKLRGFARSQGSHDIQVQTFDDKLHLLTEAEYRSITREKESLMPPLKATAAERRDLIAYLSRLTGIVPGPVAAGTRVEPVSAEAKRKIEKPEPGEWPTYNGLLSANRHSPLTQIDQSNAGKLQLAWSYSIPYQGLEMTPLVSDGVMYVSGPNQVCALDSRTGREIWCYVRPRSAANTIAGDAAKGANRGVALQGDRVFFATDNAHLICLHRLTGTLLWEVKMPVSPGQFGATAAPLVVEDLVISGIGGGDGPLRGFLAAYKVTTGELAWRFWTIPARGEPGSETWQGTALETGGGATWVTGSYDPETGLLYWPTGNPFPDTDGDQRLGDNLYTNCVVALDWKTGKLQWYFQFTPHDLHDWDATEPLVLVDTKFQGRDHKLLLQANRSGFFYVLDRPAGSGPMGGRNCWRVTSRRGRGPRPVQPCAERPTGIRPRGIPIRGCSM